MMHETIFAIVALGLPWAFNFEVKFYPPEPENLVEDLARHLVCLQLRNDICTTRFQKCCYKNDFQKVIFRLPASFAAQAELGGLVAQSELGDLNPAQSDESYVTSLNKIKVAQPLPDQENFIQHVKEYHTHKRSE
jgi:erythrocyte membrane protein band 4.1